jgi:CBS domain-containing protein
MSILKLARVPAASASWEATVLDAARTMHEQKVGAVAVLKDDKLAGVFTERDLMTRVVLAGLDPKTTPVTKVMTADVATVDDKIAVSAALRLMVERHFRHLPVVDEKKKVLGMLSMRHLLRQRVDILNSQLDALQNYVSADGIGG